MRNDNVTYLEDEDDSHSVNKDDAKKKDEEGDDDDDGQQDILDVIILMIKKKAKEVLDETITINWPITCGQFVESLGHRVEINQLWQEMNKFMALQIKICLKIVFKHIENALGIYCNHI